MKKKYDNGITLFFALGAITEIFCKKLGREFEDIARIEDKNTSVPEQLEIFRDLLLSFWAYGCFALEDFEKFNTLTNNTETAKLLASVKLDEITLEQFAKDIVEFLQTTIKPNAPSNTQAGTKKK